MKVHYKDYFEDIKGWTERHSTPELNITDKQRERVRQASMFCVSGKATVHTNFKSGKVDQIPQKASVGRDYKSFEALLLTLQIMHGYETDNARAKVQDWMIDIVEKCAYSSINRERRAILEILASIDKELTATEIGTSKGLGLEREGVEIYLNPLFAVGLIKRHVSGKSFKWFIEEGPVKDFINKVANAVPQIKLKEDEEPPEDEIEAEEVWDNIPDKK